MNGSGKKKNSKNGWPKPFSEPKTMVEITGLEPVTS